MAFCFVFVLFFTLSFGNFKGTLVRNEKYNYVSTTVLLRHFFTMQFFKDVVTFQHKLAWQGNWLLINS